MAMTPWGDASTLRDRRLRPGPGIPRADVERNQRERLYGATVSVFADSGYAEASIAEVIEVAGVSRTTFYKYFADKEECFLATLDELLTAVLATTERAVAADGDLVARAQGGLKAFVDLMVAQPDAARVCIVESYAAGPRAIRRVDEAMKRCRELMSELFDQMPERRGLPDEMMRGMIGSLRRIMLTRLRRRQEEELTTLAPQLLELALLYSAPPRRLRSAWVRRPGTTDPPGERAPRELAERLESATMSVIARKGFADATLAEIATEAGISFSTFYATFDGKREAFEAGLYRKQLQMSAAVLPGYRAARNWAEAIRAGVLASLEFLEDEPVFAKLVTIDVYAAGGPALEQHDLALDPIARFIEAVPSYETLGIPVAAEAIQSGIYAMLPRRVRSGDTRNLRALGPIATYFAVVPFLGAEVAATVASGQAMPAG